MKTKIAWKILPQLRCMFSQGIVSLHHSWQNVVVHHNGLGRVSCLQLRFGDNHDQGFSHMANFVQGKRQLSALVDDTRGRLGKGLGLGVYGIQGIGYVVDPFESICQIIASRQNSKHARHFASGAGVDAAHTRVGMW
jgi:hypothetical protein